MAVNLSPEDAKNALLGTMTSPNNNSFVYKQYPGLWDMLQQHPNAQQTPNPRLDPDLGGGIRMLPPVPTMPHQLRRPFPDEAALFPNLGHGGQPPPQGAMPRPLSPIPDDAPDKTLGPGVVPYDPKKYQESGLTPLPNPFLDIGKYTPQSPSSKPEPNDALKFWQHPSPKVIPIREGNQNLINLLLNNRV